MIKTHLGSIAAMALLIVVADAAQVQALKIRMSPLPERVAQADAVVVGKVTDIEKKNINLRAAPKGDEKLEYQVAVVEIKDTVRGAKGLTHIRVAFQPAPADGPPRPGPRRGPLATLTKDQEGCFFLQQHFEDNLFLLNPSAPALDA